MDIKGWLGKTCMVLLLPVLMQDEIHPAGQISENDTVKIGFLIQDYKSAAALNGARLAIRNANAEGGYSGIPFKLVYRSMEGPWGTGSKQAVDLIFEEEVWGIVGSHDGRNAHLVEQACTKTNTVLISAWASDPTLAQAFVPWFFNCVPDNIKQAEILASEIFEKRKPPDIAVIADNSYDSQSALKFFLRKSGEYKNTAVKQINIPVSGSGNFNNPVVQTAIHTECIVLLCSPSNAARLLPELEKRKPELPVYGFLFLSDENDESLAAIRKSGLKVRIPMINTACTEYRHFADEYRNVYGKEPGLCSAFAYDAANLMIEAIRKCGSDREKIQAFLLKFKYEGVTGPVTFDERGKREGISGLADI